MTWVKDEKTTGDNESDSQLQNKILSNPPPVNKALGIEAVWNERKCVYRNTEKGKSIYTLLARAHYKVHIPEFFWPVALISLMR